MKASIYLDTRKEIQTGENKGRFHIKILVEFAGESRTRRYYQTGVYASRVEFKKLISGQYGKCSELERETFNTKRKALLELEHKAKDTLMPGMMPDEFEPRFRAAGSLDNPLDMLLAYSEELRRDGQIGTSIYYRSAYSSFKKFCDEKYNGRLSFVQVTPRWLMAYEKWLLEQGRSISTVGTHVRPMRTIFKKKIDSGEIPITSYPFGRNKYKCPASKGRNIALSEVDKDKVLTYKTEDIGGAKIQVIGEYQYAVDLWKFSYYCNGMNFNDVARLRRRDMDGDVLTYERNKTKNIERNRSPIIITMHPEAMRIIKQWAADDMSPDAYIFPVLRPDASPLLQKHLIADWIKSVNTDLGHASGEIGIVKITTYWARHTFATTLKRNGASIEYIQEALGHSDPRTTILYLDSFDLETKRKYSNLL